MINELKMDNLSRNRKLYFDYKKSIDFDFLSEKELLNRKKVLMNLLGNYIYQRKGGEDITKKYLEGVIKYNKGIKVELRGSYIFDLLNILENENIEEYKGNENQIKLAKRLGVINLGHFNSLLNYLGYKELLEYNTINLSVEQLENLLDELEENIDEYKGDENQIKLAKKVGIVNLGQLNNALNIFGYKDILGYEHISLPVKKLEDLEEELEENIEEYEGNINQVKLAKQVGIYNLGNLNTTLNILGYKEKLGYEYINLSVNQLEILLEELKENFEEYKGNENQIKLAKKLGISHLGSLNSALSSFGYKESLGYNVINLPVTKLEFLMSELEENIEEYKGNENQVKLAKKVGISNLGDLNKCLNIIGYKEILGYNLINLPSSKLKVLIKELEENLEEYKGNENQIKLARKVGVDNLGNLNTAIASLGYKESLGYFNIKLSVNKLETLIKELEENIEEYKGNENQVKLAKKVGINHLGALNSALTAFGYDKILGFNTINLGVNKLEKLLQELEENFEEYNGNNKQLKLAKKIGIRNLGHLNSILSYFGYRKKLGYTYIDVPVKNIDILFETIKSEKNPSSLYDLSNTVNINISQLKKVLKSFGYDNYIKQH